MNIKYKIHGSLDAHLIGNPKRELDIREAISFLEKEEYLVNYYEIPHLSTYGFVFIHPDHIKNLEQHGWLTLIDSTHKTNKYDCHLFTLYIRNYYGCWDVGAHFFVSNENSDTVAEGLKIIRRFARHWNPRYFLSNQSNIESNSIKTVTSTNSLESYHSELKRTTSPQHGLIGACQKIVALDKFRTKKISAIGIDDEILDELINEFCAVEGRIEKGKAAPGLTSLNCNCLFFHQYLLPCHHIFHENMYGTMKLLIPDLMYEEILTNVYESGFEIYIHRELVDLEVPVFKMTEAEKAMENRRLAVSELTERIRDIYWRVEERGDMKKTGAFISELKNRDPKNL
ncbi:hypothetical protein RhiirA4_431576 [Rhizophagus irregularis]|uniref:ZSWIM1/3 RNaseH-like domain-containing protein n=1 Tax=Rhizophagus irregularis TaxID=588596 RepID=A0A2I1HQB7_9GLOM|nr:hypothetical protein RhiirA4_431576 [Rhizophagus irregularis]